MQADQAPRLLSILIDLGLAESPSAELPPEWQQAYETVRGVPGGREQRLQAFMRALAGQPTGNAMYWDMVMAAPLATTSPRRRERFRIHSAAEVLKPPPAVDWCVEGLFSRPSLNLLVGDPGSKKTYLALDLAACVAIGEPWLGRKAAASPVLIVVGDEESGLPRLWARLHGVLGAHSATPATPLHFISLAGFNLRDRDEASLLQRYAHSLGAGLMIVDALADVMPGGDENKVQDVQPVFQHLRHLAEDCRAAVIVIHHTNKQGGFRGSTSISAAVDLMLAVESEPRSPLVQLRTLKSRDILPTSFSARANFENRRFWLSATEERHAPTQTKLGKAGSGVLAYLAKNGEATTQEIMAGVEGISPKQVRKALYPLAQDGAIVRLNPHEEGKAAVYSLTEKGGQLTLRPGETGLYPVPLS